jgi:hypothetical protein
VPGADTSPRDPRKGALHRILREHLASFLAEEQLPRFLVKELRSFLDCGTFGLGCAHYRCECGADRVAALSCHGRGFCPRCGGRRMTELALDLCERVLPHERVRQWVLSFPFALRVRLAFHHDLVPRSRGSLGRRSSAATGGWLVRRASRTRAVAR